MIRLVSLKSENKDLLKFESINSEAFPPTEYVSFDVLSRLSEKMDIDILGIYKSETPVGFTVIVKNKRCAYIFLLANDKNVRSKGYGSNTLQEVMKRYPDQQMILDFEELDLKAENYLQRVKRKAFYLRNGFHETGHYTFFPDGQRCEVVCSEGTLDVKGFRDLIHEFHKYWENFPDKLA